MPVAKDIEHLITSFIREEVLRDPEVNVDVEENLFSGGLVDSISIMHVISHIEATYAMRIPPADLVPQNFRTIAVMARYLEQTVKDR